MLSVAKSSQGTLTKSTYNIQLMGNKIRSHFETNIGRLEWPLNHSLKCAYLYSEISIVKSSLLS